MERTCWQTHTLMGIPWCGEFHGFWHIEWVFWTEIHNMCYLTLPMLRLLLSKAQGCKDSWKPFKPCHVGIQLKALTEYSRMSTCKPGFQSSFSFFVSFSILATLATSSIRVKSLVCLVLIGKLSMNEIGLREYDICGILIIKMYKQILGLYLLN